MCGDGGVGGCCMTLFAMVDDGWKGYNQGVI